MKENAKSHKISMFWTSFEKSSTIFRGGVDVVYLFDEVLDDCRFSESEFSRRKPTNDFLRVDFYFLKKLHLLNVSKHTLFRKRTFLLLRSTSKTIIILSE